MVTALGFLGFSMAVYLLSYVAAEQGAKKAIAAHEEEKIMEEVTDREDALSHVDELIKEGTHVKVTGELLGESIHMRGDVVAFEFVDYNKVRFSIKTLDATDFIDIYMEVEQ